MIRKRRSADDLATCIFKDRNAYGADYRQWWKEYEALHQEFFTGEEETQEWKKLKCFERK